MNREYSLVLGNRIKEIRRALKLSQSDFAKPLSISNTFLSSIENGKTNPALDFLFNTAKVYHVSMNYLFYGIGDMFIDSGDILLESVLTEEKKFVDEMESIEDLVWLMNHSSIFNRFIMGMAGVYFIEHKSTLEKNVSHFQEKNKK